MRYALKIEYDGTDFHGSQFQKDLRTVQGEIERALSQIYGEAPRVSMAGRTDAGVHALGQVAAFDEDERHSDSTIRDALNYHLAADVAIKWVQQVRAEFDPRRMALARQYVFTLNDDQTPAPVNRNFEVRTKRLDSLEDMKTAASLYVGSHDFASFAGPLTPAGASTHRNIFSVEVDRTRDNRTRVTITGNAFVHQQVRRMTGALVRVGIGKMSIEDLSQLIYHPRRGAAGWPLAPEGLCLTGIEYGKDGPFRVETEYN